MAIETSHLLSRPHPSNLKRDRRAPRSSASQYSSSSLTCSLLSLSLLIVGCIEDRVGARLDADRTSQQNGGEREGGERHDERGGEEAVPCVSWCKSRKRE